MLAEGGGKVKCCRGQSLSAFLIVQCVLQANCWADRCKLCMSSKELFTIFISFKKSNVGTEYLQTENRNDTLCIVSCNPIGMVRIQAHFTENIANLKDVA